MMQHIFGSLTSGLLVLTQRGTLVRWLEGDQTVPGTTDGIVMMGIVIVLIILMPIVVTRRRWMR